MDIMKLTIQEAVQMPEFKDEVFKIVCSILEKRALYKQSQLKRDAVTRLAEKRCLDTKSIIELYPLALERRLNKSEFPSEERRVIIAIGDMALTELVKKLQAENK